MLKIKMKELQAITRENKTYNTIVNEVAYASL